MPTPGHMMRTTLIVSSRIAPLYPGAIAINSHGVSSTPINTRTLIASASSDATMPATRPAVSSSFSASSRAYTGMNEAESTPSPKRFCKTFGMRMAAR